MHYSVTIAQLYTCIQCIVPELWFGVDECGEGWTHYWSIYGAAGSISQYRPPATCQGINTSPLGKFWENRGKNINQNKHSNKHHFMIPPICSIIMLSAKHYFVLTPFLSKILLVLRCILNGATTTWHFPFCFWYTCHSRCKHIPLKMHSAQDFLWSQRDAAHTFHHTAPAACAAKTDCCCISLKPEMH